jgi:hypothetical protein
MSCPAMSCHVMSVMSYHVMFKLRYVMLYWSRNVKEISQFSGVFKLQPEDGFMRAETCSCNVLLIKYILYNKVVIGYKLVSFINY